MGFDFGYRHSGKTLQALQWQFPGAAYRAEIRFFKKASEINLASDTGNFDLGPAANERILVNRVSFILADDAAGWSDITLGAITAPAVGLTFTLRKADAQVHDFTAEGKIKSNITLFQYTAPDFTTVTLDSGNRLLVATFDLVGSMAPVYLDAATDLLRVNVNEALTGLARLNVRADCFSIRGDE